MENSVWTPPQTAVVKSQILLPAEGEHAIQILSKTPQEATTEELVINVGGNNNEPLCEIVEPTSGSAYVVGQNITFTGTTTMQTSTTVTSTSLGCPTKMEIQRHGAATQVT